MAAPHDKIIADAAKSSLGPLGFRRQGRSRTWLADHDWWVTVVEFQPSSWSKGSYLNVAAHWLWSAQDYVSFDFGGRLAEHVKYISDMQFAAAVTHLVESAAQEAQRLAQVFVSLDATAEVLLTAERSSRDTAQGGWGAYHAGLAAGLIGRAHDATEMFARILNGFAQPQSVLNREARHMAQLAGEPERLQREVVSLIERHRSTLGLSVLPAIHF